MRNMSFMLTTAQIRDRSKTVTRRLGWWNLRVGDVVMACEKCQGLGKGGKIITLTPSRSCLDAASHWSRSPRPM